jgi:HEAT repeat protein
MAAALFLLAAGRSVSELELVFWSLVALAVAFGLIQQSRKANRVWREEASRLGLEVVKGGFLGGRSIEGEFHGFPVRVETFTSNRELHTRVTVDTRDRIPKWIELRAEAAWSGVAKVFTGEDILTGDQEFDAAVNVSGQEPVAAALLGEQTRRSVRRLISSGGGVRQGCLYLEKEGRMSEPGEIRDAVGMLVKFASDLPAGKPAERLLANATSDRIPGVRLQNLRLLDKWFRTEEETRRGAERALSDPEPSIRLLAATLVPAGQGAPVLKGLLEDPAIADDVLRDAVRAAGAAKDASLLAPLYALVPRHDPALAEAVATALGQLGDAEAENALLRLLGRDDVEVKRAAAAALGLVGTIRAVEPLLLLAKGPVAGTARDAVRRIQAKLGDAESGRLSIAEQEAAVGGLSIAAGGSEVTAASEGAGEGNGDAAVPRAPVKC